MTTNFRKLSADYLRVEVMDLYFTTYMGAPTNLKTDEFALKLKNKINSRVRSTKLKQNQCFIS